MTPENAAASTTLSGLPTVEQVYGAALDRFKTDARFALRVREVVRAGQRLGLVGDDRADYNEAMAFTAFALHADEQLWGGFRAVT